MKIPVYTWNSIDPQTRKRILSRSELDISEVRESVQTIIENVAAHGDAALRRYAAEFDRADFDSLPLEVTEQEFSAAESGLEAALKEAIDYAIENIRTFHEPQVPRGIDLREIGPGIWAGERAVPIESVGLYVPRGRGSFPSMLYMLAVPAKLAGVPEIAVVTPPGPGGEIDAACLYAAKKIGIARVFRAGGAQAIAALAYGTESVPKVLKVVGPGSRYVAAAKRLLSDLIDPGLPAGPSESIVWADASADPGRICLDLLVEAEHGADSSALLVTEDSGLVLAVAERLPNLIEATPEPRRGFLETVFSPNGYGACILTASPEESAEVINTYAPEHLSIQTASPWDSLSLVRNAGEILLGPHLPFSAANYATGANAVLPTGGYAKTCSAVSVRDFVKFSSVVQVTERGLRDLSPRVALLAEYEGFPRHAAALKERKPKT